MQEYANQSQFLVLDLTVQLEFVPQHHQRLALDQSDKPVVIASSLAAKYLGNQTR